jgi:hypothetical protein
MFHTQDAGITWLPFRQEGSDLSQAVLPENTILSGWVSDALGWAATTIGSCSGEKSQPGFACTSQNAIWQTIDGGDSWQSITLPEWVSADP